VDKLLRYSLISVLAFACAQGFSEETASGEKPAPLAFADFSWVPGNYGPPESKLATKYFTPELRLDTAYHYQFARPKDHTISGSSEVFRHGEFQVTDYMGDDSSPAQAARTSYGEGTKTLTDDKKLIDTLVREKHTSPIEMCELAIVEKTPVMIDPRQLGRHRTLDFTGFLNIHPIGPQFYQPFVEELKKQDRVNRQGRGEPIEQKRVEVVQTLFREAVDDTNRTLEELAVAGVSEELLREQRGVGFYTIVSRTGDPLNWARFLQLRNDPHAQKESQCYAQQVAEALKAHIPATYKAFEDHWFKAVTFGETEQRLIKEKGLLRREDLPAPEELAGTPLAIPIDRNDNSKGHKWSRQGLDFINRLGQLKG
jgi:thymidylate synthase (FAD)